MEANKKMTVEEIEARAKEDAEQSFIYQRAYDKRKAELDGEAIRDIGRQLEYEFKEAYLRANAEGKASQCFLIDKGMTYRCSQCLAKVGLQYSSCPVCGQFDKEANG